MKSKTEDGQFLDEIIFEAVETVKIGDATLTLEGSCGHMKKYGPIRQAVAATVRLSIETNRDVASLYLMRERKSFRDDREKPEVMKVAREQWIPKMLTYFEDFKKLKPEKP